VAKDDGTLEYVFEAAEQNSSNEVTKEKVAEIAAGFMTTSFLYDIGAFLDALETATGHWSSNLPIPGYGRR
jgi:hypothetical protein